MITPAAFAAFVTNVNTMIGAVYAVDDVDSVYKEITTELPCSSAILQLGWTGLMPKMRGWFGPRQPHEPAPQTYSIEMIPYENTYACDRFILDDDQFGILYRTLPDMARQAKRQPDYEVRDLIEDAGLYAGTARQSGFDGLSHWNSAHPINLYNASAGTYTNTTVGGQSIGGVTVGGPIGPTAIMSIYEYMTTIKGEDGERLGVKPNRLMHGPTLKAEVELCIKSTFFSPPSWGAWAPITGQVGSADNPLKRFGLDPLQNDFLNNATQYYMLDTTKAFKPFLWVNREATRVANRTSETDPVVFDSHTFTWGQWNRKSAAWDYAFLSHRSG